MASGYARSSGGGPSSSSRSSSHRAPFSFLFVVNKIKFKTDNPYPMDADHWGNMLPPCDKRAYSRETASRVMRYKDGRVTLADGYYWCRPKGWHTDGYIFGPSEAAIQQPTRYKVQTVFSCNPFIPIVTIKDDMTTCNIDKYKGPNWELLRFEHRSNTYPGVSFATGREGPRQYVAGSSPSWIPSLVPTSYLSPFDEQDSQGLGGDLPLVLALMSFWYPWGMDHHERMERVFHGRQALWRDRSWRVADPEYGPSGYSNPEYLPNGLVVQVSLDNVQNPMGSTAKAMMDFEASKIVRDDRRG